MVYRADLNMPYNRYSRNHTAMGEWHEAILAAGGGGSRDIDVLAGLRRKR
jgi:hypothetical protein